MARKMLADTELDRSAAEEATATHYDFDLFVIGAGSGGVRAARFSANNGAKVVVKVSNTHPKDMEVPPSGVDDMTTLAYLHEPGVLQNLKSRYYIDEIYTYTGNILIVVNPFKQLENLYNDNMIAQYKGAAFGELSLHHF